MVVPSLRVARTNEAPAVAALVNTAFQVETFFKRGDRTDAAEVRDLMQRGEFLVLDDSQAAGDQGTGHTACVYTRTNGDRGYFGMLSIDPRSQGRGLGRSIVAAVESVFERKAAGPSTSRSSTCGRNCRRSTSDWDMWRPARCRFRMTARRRSPVTSS